MVAGLNRASWNLDYPGAVTFPNMVLWGATTNGPMALPGAYQVRLTVDGKSQTQPLTIRKHPLRNTPDADTAQQFALAIQIRDRVSEANNAVIQIRRIKDEVKDRLTKSQDAQLKAAGDRLTDRLSAVEQDIYQVKNQSGQDPLNFPIKLNNKLAASLLGMSAARRRQADGEHLSDLRGPEEGAEGGDRSPGGGAVGRPCGIQPGRAESGRRRGEQVDADAAETKRHRSSGEQEIRRKSSCLEAARIPPGLLNSWSPVRFCDSRRYFSVNVISTLTSTSTGLSSFVPGLKRHCRRATMAS
jgi:hypothetical protein